MKTMQQMALAVKSGQSEQALAEYAKLPQKLQEMKMTQLLRIMAAYGVDEMQYLAAIEEYERLFPGDPSVDLIAIDGFVLRKEWQAAHDAIDRLDQALGGDPYLQVMHGGTHVLAGDYQRALERAQTVLAADPRDEQAHWLLVNISLARKDHAETARLLAKLRDELRLEIADLTQLPEYADFVRSPEYDEWKRSILK
jgi:predicted Zn-dependent protease